MRIGIDLDNTIIHYGHAFRSAAAARGLPRHVLKRSKSALQDAVIALEDGATEWQRLQGIAYGRGLNRARLSPGFREFTTACRRARAEVFIVSHKTKRSRYSDGVNFREAAIAWMHTRRFFDGRGLGMRLDQVFFEPTRAHKVQRIAQLECDVFIDDLVEVFLEPGFPRRAQQILLSRLPPRPGGTWAVCRDWRSIRRLVFAT